MISIHRIIGIRVRRPIENSRWIDLTFVDDTSEVTITLHFHSEVIVNSEGDHIFGDCQLMEDLYAALQPWAKVPAQGHQLQTDPANLCGE